MVKLGITRTPPPFAAEILMVCLELGVSVYLCLCETRMWPVMVRHMVIRNLQNQEMNKDTGGRGLNVSQVQRSSADLSFTYCS